MPSTGAILVLRDPNSFGEEEKSQDGKLPYLMSDRILPDGSLTKLVRVHWWWVLYVKYSL